MRQGKGAESVTRGKCGEKGTEGAKKRVDGAKPLPRCRARSPAGFGQSPSVPLRLFHVKDVENSTRCMPMEATHTHALYAEMSQPLPRAAYPSNLYGTGSDAVSEQLGKAVRTSSTCEDADVSLGLCPNPAEAPRLCTLGRASPVHPLFLHVKGAVLYRPL